MVSCRKLVMWTVVLLVNSYVGVLDYGFFIADPLYLE